MNILAPHSFRKSLAASHKASDLPIWEEMYRQAFPTFKALVDHREDGEHQRAGVDRSVILGNTNRLFVDEKVRFKNRNGKIYNDIALEYWHDRIEGIPGWVCKTLRADFIAYAIAPLGLGYLLPVPQLQSAWNKYKKDWISKFPEIVSPNQENGHYWETVSVGVPVNVLFPAIGEMLRLTCERYDKLEDGSFAKL